jgi:hypothetical protein
MHVSCSELTFWHQLINFISSIWIHHYPVNGIKSDMNWQEERPKCVLIPENLPRHPKWWVQEHNIGCPMKLISKASTLLATKISSLYRYYVLSPSCRFNSETFCNLLFRKHSCHYSWPSASLHGGCRLVSSRLLHKLTQQATGILILHSLLPKSLKYGVL